jgi:hypothetical protein
MHAVRVDQPIEDGIADFLLVNENAIDLVPEWIYLSDSRTQPFGIIIGNITDISCVPSKSIQVIFVMLCCSLATATLLNSSAYAVVHLFCWRIENYLISLKKTVLLANELSYKF